MTNTRSENFEILFLLKIYVLKKEHKTLISNNIYHLETPRFNEGTKINPLLTFSIYSKHHIYTSKWDVLNRC